MIARALCWIKYDIQMITYKGINMYCERWKISIWSLIDRDARTDCEIKCRLMTVVTSRRFRMLNVNDREGQKSGRLISSRHLVVSLTVKRTRRRCWRKYRTRKECPYNPRFRHSAPVPLPLPLPLSFRGIPSPVLPSHSVYLQ